MVGSKLSLVLSLPVLPAPLNSWTVTVHASVKTFKYITLYCYSYNQIQVDLLHLRHCQDILGKPQKNNGFFSGPATKRGGGKGLATKKKYRLLKL